MSAVAVAEAQAPLRLPIAEVVVGLFTHPGQLLDALKALRALPSAASSGDIVGFAIPLEGEPDSATVRVRGWEQPKKFDLMTFVLDLIDPHRPTHQLDGWTRGKSGPLAAAVLGDLTHWLVGVKTFRLPGPDGAGSGVWLLARSNQAATVHGFTGGAAEGAAGALATLGVPRERVAEVAEKLIRGYCLITLCENDLGRVARDRRIIEKHGAVDITRHEIVAVSGER